MFTFSFTPNRIDYVHTFRAYYYYRRSIKVILFVFVVISLCSLSTLFLGSFQAYQLFLPVMTIFLFLTFFYLSPSSVGDKVVKEERLHSEVTWQVDEEKIIVNNKFSEAKVDWGTFGEVLETSDHFMLVYAVQHNMFQIVPKRAFPTKAMLEEFRELMAVKGLRVRHIRDVNLPDLSSRAVVFIVFGVLVFTVLVTIVINFLQVR
jgi:hypothetical protein